jgi:hypothetical protein
MAYIPRSSLIPNEASGAIPAQMKKRRTIHAFGLIATLIFILSLLSAIGVYVYKGVLDTRLAEAKTALTAVSSDDGNRKRLEEIQIYDNKLSVAKGLLDNHIAPSKIFEELEDSTKETVQFRALEFVYDPGFEAMLTLSGDTEELTSIALQKMQVLEDELFSDFVLQSITKSDKTSAEAEEEAILADGISFKIVGIFRKNLIEYSGGESREEVVEAPVTIEAAEGGAVPTEAPTEPASAVLNPFTNNEVTP